MRRILYVGNCQMQGLRSLHDRFVTPVSDDVASWVNPYQTFSDADYAAIAAADLIVGQVNNKQSIDNLAALASQAPRHLVPTLGGSFHWPFAGQSHINHLQHGPYIGDLGDGFLNRMIKQGVPPDEAVQRYLDLDINSMVNLDRLLEVNLDQQRDRDALTGYCFAELIADLFRDEHLFLTPYHPNTALSRLWAMEVWQRIGVAAEPIARLEQQLTWAPFPPAARPIHPFVIRHFGLRFLADEPRFRFPSESSSVTFSEYARRYMRSEWNESLDEAVILAFTGQQDGALEKLQVGVEQSPGSVEGVRLLSVRLAQLRRHDEAIAIVRRAIAIDPAEPYQYSRLAELLHAVGDLTEGEIMARHAIELAPDIGVFHRRLSSLLIAQGRLIEAEAEARTAVALDPHTPENFLHLGTMLTETNQLAAAESAVRQAIAMSPRTPSAHLALSRILRHQLKFDAAIAAAHLALEIVPLYTPIYHHLSTIQEESGRPDEAEATLRGGIEAAPRAPYLRYRLADLLERQGKIDEAIEALRHAAVLDPANADTRLHLSNLLDRAGQADAAETALRDAMAIAPQLAKLHHDLAALLERHDRLDAAIEVASGATALAAPIAQGYAQLSRLLTVAGRLDDAETATRQGIERFPEFIELHNRMGLLLQRRGDLDGALQSAATSVRLNPTSAVAHFRHSQLLAARQEIEPAIEAARRAVALNVSEATSHARLGNLLADSMRFDEAEDAFVQALALAPDNPGIQQMLERVRTRRAMMPKQAASTDRAPAAVPAASEATITAERIAESQAATPETTNTELPPLLTTWPGMRSRVPTHLQGVG
jgi:tetratricopeptide (TPR) repeat protein